MDKKITFVIRKKGADIIFKYKFIFKHNNQVYIGNSGSRKSTDPVHRLYSFYTRKYFDSMINRHLIWPKRYFNRDIEKYGHQLVFFTASVNSIFILRNSSSL